MSRGFAAMSRVNTASPRARPERHRVNADQSRVSAATHRVGAIDPRGEMTMHRVGQTSAGGKRTVTGPVPFVILEGGSARLLAIRHKTKTPDMDAPGICT